MRWHWFCFPLLLSPFCRCSPVNRRNSRTLLLSGSTRTLHDEPHTEPSTLETRSVYHTFQFLHISLVCVCVCVRVCACACVRARAQWSSLHRPVRLRGRGGGRAHLLPGGRHRPPWAHWPGVGAGPDPWADRNIPPELCRGVGAADAVTGGNGSDRKSRWANESCLYSFIPSLLFTNFFTILFDG